MGRLAILSFRGALPGLLAAAHPGALTVGFRGVPAELPGGPGLSAEFERFGTLFDDLRAAGVTEVVFAGALARPALDPARFDGATQALAPRILAALKGGDDGLLRTVIAAFEEAGFAVRGAHELLPDLTAAPGLLAGPAPSEADLADAARARAILAALGPLDVGQGAVVAGGLCLGIETLQGTDAMLDFVAATPAGKRPRAPGVFVKAPKPGQDLRVDMPAVGPGTVARATRAGLAGLVVTAGQVLLLERAETLGAVGAAGLFLYAEAP